MGSVLVIILSTSELLQMKHLLVLTAVGLQPQRREHILTLHFVSFSQGHTVTGTLLFGDRHAVIRCYLESVPVDDSDS